ncbi:hypothetical protein PHLCEN_2v5380 [Hermanssonia centrifuga]|uniref:Uncharacterized protein n=1 Tax=Hermanssonia centrifuga TaxID=98765 RepID=A0A2R6P5D6_9APHY|nr:hypothetical protein PHLCEN_2v5380 [Hermanssonia centrifuga]
MEGKAPKFPMSICNRSFELIVGQLKALTYDGPVALSWDDTKLLPAWRFYWDTQQQTHFLVGAVNGPIRVADPEAARAIMTDTSYILGSKVRLFCLQIPLAGVAPIMVAGIPITEKLDVLQLEPLSSQVLHGLLDRDVHVVSCSCDGTETERSVQHTLVENAESQHVFKVPSPLEGHVYELTIRIPIIHNHPVVMVQDSLHARKTFRNNLFSGARLLALGNHAAFYRHIRQIAFEQGSPLYHRDVEKLDRQDDNAAARLFSAETLRFIIQRHPTYLGDIVFLFVFGELPDAYQNRRISHGERIKIALRAHYFVCMWQAYLHKAGYAESRYFISREAADITSYLIEGVLGLVVVHRDQYARQKPFPLLIWHQS